MCFRGCSQSVSCCVRVSSSFPVFMRRRFGDQLQCAMHPLFHTHLLSPFHSHSLPLSLIHTRTPLFHTLTLPPISSAAGIPGSNATITSPSSVSPKSGQVGLASPGVQQVLDETTKKREVRLMKNRSVG